MTQADEMVVNVDDLEWEDNLAEGRYGSLDKHLTPAMRSHGGRLGVNLTRVSPGRSACPFHTHQLEDEVFYVLSGTGVLRYGESLRRIGPGDCVSCPAGSGVAHQLANTGDEDLVYLAIGPNEPNEVATYPDSGKVFVRALGLRGRVAPADYYDGEPATPRIFELARDREP